MSRGGWLVGGGGSWAERSGVGGRGEGSRIPERRRPVCGTPARSVESRRLRHNPISLSFFNRSRLCRSFGPRFSRASSSCPLPFRPTKRPSPSLPRRRSLSLSDSKPVRFVCLPEISLSLRSCCYADLSILQRTATVVFYLSSSFLSGKVSLTRTELQRRPSRTRFSYDFCAYFFFLSFFLFWIEQPRKERTDHEARETPEDRSYVQSEACRCPSFVRRSARLSVPQSKPYRRGLT